MENAVKYSVYYSITQMYLALDHVSESDLADFEMFYACYSVIDELKSSEPGLCLNQYYLHGFWILCQIRKNTSINYLLK